MKIALEDANKNLRTIIRTIDRKIDYHTTLVDGDKPGVALTLVKREKTKTIVIKVETLLSSQEDPVKRHELRNRIKRAYDRMLFVAPPMASTKMVRGSTSADGYFRPQNSGGPRR